MGKAALSSSLLETESVRRYKAIGETRDDVRGLLVLVHEGFILAFQNSVEIVKMGLIVRSLSFARVLLHRVGFAVLLIVKYGFDEG